MNKKLIKDYADKITKETGVKVSMAESEQQIINAMQKVAKVLAPSFRFGYHSNEDMEQEGIHKALIVLNKEETKYDVNRPLENFLYVLMHNELYNYKRKHYTRLEPPCNCCKLDSPAYPCQKWLDWKVRNSAKQNIMRPLDMSNISDEFEYSMRDNSKVVDDTIASELRVTIDKNLPVDLRRDYLQMLDGKLIPKGRREKVRQAVMIIIEDGGYIDAT